STGSHQNSEVKRAWARVVLGWVTSWEVLVLHSFFFRFRPFRFADRRGYSPRIEPFWYSKPTGSRGTRRGGKTFARGRGAGPTCGFGTSRYRDKRKDGRKYVGCDHTSTKAPDPIRTPKLSVLGRE